MELIADDIDFEAYAIDRSDHAKVLPASTFADAIIERAAGNFGPTGPRLPWKKTHDTIRLRDGEVSVWNGINGHGKSLILGQVILGMMQQDIRSCIASFEMKPDNTLFRMSRQYVGTNQPTSDAVLKFTSRTDGRLWMYDQTGTVKASKVLGVIYYAAETYGVRQFVVDSLMKCGIDDDDYGGQKKFIDQLCAAAKDTGCHIHLVTHARKGVDEMSMTNKMDVKGSGTITDQADNVFTAWRNKRKEELVAKGQATDEDLDSPDAMLNCDKQRNGEWEGKIALWLDKKSLRYLESRHEKVWGYE